MSSLSRDSSSSTLTDMNPDGKKKPSFVWQLLGCSKVPRCDDQRRCCRRSDVGERDDTESPWHRSPHDDFDDPYVEAIAKPFGDQKPNLLGSLSISSNTERISIPWATLSKLPRSGLSIGGASAPSFAPSTVPGDLPRSRSVKSARPSINPVTGFISMVVPACEYGPARGDDPVDVEFVRQLQLLHRDSAATMMVRMLAPGRYEIDGTRITARLSQDSLCPGVLVQEEGVRDSAAIPLFAYLEHASMIAVQITPSAPRTLTFENEGAPLARADHCDRIEQMELACHQANVRQEAAYAFNLHS